MPKQAKRSYIICTSPRSGSTMLCEMLRATGVAGRPASLFHTPALAAWLEAYDLRASDYGSVRETLKAVFAAALAEGTGDTETFGLRLQRGSFDFFMEQIHTLHPGQPSDLACIEAAFGPTVFIHLSRGDTLGQAISCLRAEQTGLWHRRADGTELERQDPKRQDGYDRAAI